jgi:uncharacterized membrane protein
MAARLARPHAEPTTRRASWTAQPAATRTPGRSVGRVALGAFVAFAGVSHLTTAREEFHAQVPAWVPLDPDTVVVASGVVEIAFGAALLAVGSRHRAAVGWVVAAFFVAVFPGNVSQLVTRTDAFGLDSDAARAVRLLLQPLLVGWALWSTGAWRRPAREPLTGRPATGRPARRRARGAGAPHAPTGPTREAQRRSRRYCDRAQA